MVSLVALLVSAGMAASPPVGPPVADAALDLDSAIGRLADGGDDLWAIPVLDEPDEEEVGGAQLRLRLLKLKLRVPI